MLFKKIHSLKINHDFSYNFQECGTIRKFDKKFEFHSVFIHIFQMFHFHIQESRNVELNDLINQKLGKLIL